MKRLLNKFALLSLGLTLLGLNIGAPLAYAGTANPEFSSNNACADGSEESCNINDGSSPCAQDINNCGLMKVVRGFIAFFIAFAGVAIVISIIIGGIQYSMSAGDPSKATAARRRIINAIIALIFFFFLFALLNFLVPGGIV